MTKNPFLNALAAIVYVVLVVLVINTGSKTMPHSNPLLAGIAMISLFTLSAAMMGYIFCYQPIQLFLDGKKKQAINLFLQTVAVFAGFTVLMLILLFSGIIK